MSKFAFTLLHFIYTFVERITNPAIVRIERRSIVWNHLCCWRIFSHASLDSDPFSIRNNYPDLLDLRYNPRGEEINLPRINKSINLQTLSLSLSLSLLLSLPLSLSLRPEDSRHAWFYFHAARSVRKLTRNNPTLFFSREPRQGRR